MWPGWARNFRGLTGLYQVVKFRFGSFFPLILGAGFLLAVFAYGLFIFVVVEGWTLLDSFYQVVMTLSTVGFMELHPLSDRARLMVAVLILMGVGSFAYLVGAFTQVVVEGRLQDLWGKRKMQKIINALADHYIICGFGRIGAVVAAEIRRENLPVVILEKDPELLAELERENLLFLEGDATTDELLLAAGVERARGLFACVSQDAENVYITLSSRQFNPDLTIIARADRPESISKLERAGANRVLTPHQIGGKRIAQVMLRPTVTDFVDLATQGHKLQMEEIQVRPGCELVGKNLITSGIRPRFNLMIIAIEKADGGMIFNPHPEAVIEAGDTLIAVGPPENFDGLQRVCRSEAESAA
ncbi:MAG: potassium channel protein [Desulfovibrionales bacterium]|nr:potassium channel protein [Desulfovibrionales bacterium]